MNTYARSGMWEERVEKVFDRFIASQTEKKISKSLKTITEKLTEHLEKSKEIGTKRDMIRYVNHLLCMKRSLVDGILCRDNYYPKGVLTKEKDEMTLEQRRQILVTEHNIRRENR